MLRRVIGFAYIGDALACDGVPLADVARAAGTPLYVYSAATVRERYRALVAPFSGHPHAVHYALKANSTLAIVRLLRTLGAGADANSGGEIEVAMRAGFIPPQIVFTGVGKTQAELERAVSLGLKAINAESPGELERIGAIAAAQGVRARVALRVNPDIDAASHPHISTGLSGNKFGVPIGTARDVCRRAAANPALELRGLHVHIGSQIMTVEPLARAARSVAALARELADDGIPIEHLDLGGGLGIAYNEKAAPRPEDYAAAVLDAVRGTDLSLVLEPGRVIVGPAGALLTTVVDVKAGADGRPFVVADAGMSELMRPALYGAYHRIVPAVRRDEPPASVDIVGPLCESSDTLGADRSLPIPRVGDLLVVLDAGAYGSAMASNYNRRALPAEALVQDGRWRVVRRRQTVDEMLALED
jgi:diaminopimelate decarboxylase